MDRFQEDMFKVFERARRLSRTDSQVSKPSVYLMYCGIILICVGRCLWIVKILLICGNVISWVIGLLHCNTGQIITLSNVRGDLNLWVGFTNEILEPQSPTNNDDSTVINHEKKKINEKQFLFPLSSMKMRLRCRCSSSSRGTRSVGTESVS